MFFGDYGMFRHFIPVKLLFWPLNWFMWSVPEASLVISILISISKNDTDVPYWWMVRIQLEKMVVERYFIQLIRIIVTDRMSDRGIRVDRHLQNLGETSMLLGALVDDGLNLPNAELHNSRSPQTWSLKNVLTVNSVSHDCILWSHKYNCFRFSFPWLYPPAVLLRSSAVVTV